MAVIGVALQPVHPPSNEIIITPSVVSTTFTTPSWASRTACTPDGVKDELFVDHVVIPLRGGGLSKNCLLGVS